MELAVFGATGRTGRHVVQEALCAGYTVRAFVRNPEKLDRSLREDERLSVVRGDVLDICTVRQAVEEADVVISALGHASGSPEDILTRGGENILAVMDTCDVSRLVIVAGAGVRHPKDPFSLGGRVLSAGLKLFIRRSIEDTNRYVKTVIESDREWVVVRPARLTDGPRTAEYRTGYLKLGPQATISRADVGAFIVQTAETDEWVHEAPMLAY